MMLVDTSVWVDYLAGKDLSLREHLERGTVVTHPFIVGELACGNLKQPQALLESLQQLPSLPQASNDEVLFMIERQQLMGKGIGYIDAHLLAAVLIDGTVKLWTRDARLRQAAAALGVEAAPEQLLWTLHTATERYRTIT